jgi:hypothetical protein
MGILSDCVEHVPIFLDLPGIQTMGSTGDILTMFAEQNSSTNVQPQTFGEM